MTEVNEKHPATIDFGKYGKLHHQVIRATGDEYHYYGNLVDLPGLGTVSVIFYPDEKGKLTLHAFVRKSIQAVNQVLKCEHDIRLGFRRKLSRLFHRYFPDETEITGNDLLEGLQLTHIKLCVRTGIELIYSESPHFGFDLNVRLNKECRAKRLWFDG